MGKYTLVISIEAKAQIASLYKTGNAALIRKLEQILRELIDHPKTGTGKVEKLKGELQGYWSRRLNRKHQIVYEINDENVTVYVISAKSHYGDK
ncbi:MAG: Txe/YoeB family addiction module toxin [Bacteroidetes bacterium]|nr:Txe/YoeB family addiction module toxin [Bacteroidota bacterium]